LLRRETFLLTRVVIAFFAPTFAQLAPMEFNNSDMLHVRNRIRMCTTPRRKTMQRIVQTVVGLAVALGASGLMFAVTLA
jgi:hypothetical protein